MSRTATHLATLTPSVAGVALRRAVAGFGLLVLAGCQSFSGEGSAAQVRVVDLATDAVPVDVYHGSSAVAYNLSFGTVTSYVPVTPGGYTMTVDAAGSKQTLSVLKGSFNAGTHYTLLVNSSAADLQQVLLADQPSTAPAANPSIRLLHQSVRAGAVDVYVVPAGQRLSATAPLVTGLAAGVATPYLSIPTGIFAVVMLPAGTPPASSTAVHAGRQLRYSSGVARTWILVDAQVSSTSNVQVIMTNDAEPAG